MEVEKVAEHIVQWLKSYATNAKTKGFVVGVSGGIDSAVTSSLCAMTGLPTLCLEMPIHQAKDQSSRAHKHVLQLCTKYKNVKGQHVDLSPIADLLKSEVFALGRFLGIIREIIEAAPTDGLYHDSKTDEQQLGATYDELEWAMKMSQESDQNTSQLSPRQEEVLSIYQRLNRANQHKMNPIPVCIIPENLR